MLQDQELFFNEAPSWPCIAGSSRLELISQLMRLLKVVLRLLIAPPRLSIAGAWMVQTRARARNVQVNFPTY
jgi:hypothetical protein